MIRHFSQFKEPIKPTAEQIRIAKEIQNFIMTGCAVCGVTDVRGYAVAVTMLVRIIIETDAEAIQKLNSGDLDIVRNCFKQYHRMRVNYYGVKTANEN